MLKSQSREPGLGALMRALSCCAALANGCSGKCLEYPSMTGGGPQNGGNGSPVSLRLVIVLVLTAPAATPAGAASCSIGRTPSTHEEKWPGRTSHLEHARAVLDVVRVNLLPHPVKPGSGDPTRAQPLPRPSSTSPAPLEAGASPASRSERSRKRITLGTTAPLRPPTGRFVPSACPPLLNSVSGRIFSSKIISEYGNRQSNTPVV